MNKVQYGYKLPVLGLILLLLSSFLLATNAQAELLFPKEGASLQGNIIISVNVEHSVEIQSVFVGFPSSQRAIRLCSSNCGTNFYRTITGINPSEFGQQSGNLRLELLIVDVLGVSTIVHAVNFSWQQVNILGLGAERTAGNITITWSPLSGYYRYNLYLSSEPGITTTNIESLPDGQAIRSLTSTSFTITDRDDEQPIYALVTGVNSSGESAFSEELLITSLINEEPVANDDAFTVDEDIDLIGNVLENDTDLNEEDILVLEPEPLVPPTNGTLTLNEDGNFNYVASKDFNGEDEFVYQINDGREGTASATVKITITPVNDVPIASDDEFTLEEDTPLIISAPGLLENDTDIENDILSVSILPVTPPEHGELLLNSDGTFTYTPVENYNGNDAFEYQVDDSNEGLTTALVNLTITPVEDSPVAHPDQYQVNEDVTLLVPVDTGLLNNDIDADEDPITVIGIVNAPSHGEAFVNSDGSFSYQPKVHFFGNDSFSYEISDGSSPTAIATVSIIVVPVDDPPIAQDDIASTEKSVPVTVNVLENDSDPDGETLNVISATASNGIASFTSTTVTYTPNSGFSGTDTVIYTIEDANNLTATANIAITVNAVGVPPVANEDSLTTDEDTPASIQPLVNDTDEDGDVLQVVASSAINGTTEITDSATITYTPNPNYFGSDVISYTVADTTNETASSIVRVTVNAVNDPPTAVNDQATTTENVQVTIDVLANDSDVEGDSLSIVSVTASNGSALISGQSILFTPTINFSGLASVSYTVEDSNGATATADVSITVSAVNDPPVANSDSATTGENTSVVINVLINDSDPDGDTLSITSASASNGSVSISGSSLVYSPNLRFFGTDTISYSIADGNGGTASSTVIVTVNSAPVAVTDAYTLYPGAASGVTVAIPVSVGVLVNDTDRNSSPLSATIDSNASFGTVTVNSDGSFTYLWNGVYSTSDSFSYRVSNGQASSVATVNLTLEVENALAEICNILPASAEVGQNFTHSIQGSDDDAGDTITYSALNLPNWLSLNATTGVLSGTPSDSDIGMTNTIEISVSDGKDVISRSHQTITVYDDFGTANMVTLDFGGIDKVADVAIDNKGNILVVGSSDGDIAIARLLPNGNLDVSFSPSATAGISTINTGHVNDIATAVTVDKNNNIFIAAQGGTNADLDFVLIKLLEDGSLDTSFDSDGIAIADIGTVTGGTANSDDRAVDILIHDDTHITLVGYYQNEDFDLTLVHFNFDGSLHTGFGTNGALINTLANDQTAYRAMLDNENNIYVVGSHNNGTDEDIYIARSIYGAWDSNFASSGFFTFDDGSNEIMHDITFDGRGNILVAGEKGGNFALYNFSISFSNPNYVLALNTAGFGSGSGKLITDLGGSDVANHVLSDRRGNFYALGVTDGDEAIVKLSANGVFGTSNSISSTSTIVSSTGVFDGVGRLIMASTSNNDVDITNLSSELSNLVAANPTYASCAYTSLSIDPLSTVDTIADVAEASDGDFYAVGHSVSPADSFSDFVAYKFSGKGSTDGEFGEGGFIRHDANSGYSLTTVDAATTSNHDLIMVGYQENDRLYVAKFNVSGQLDTSFNAGGSVPGVNDFGGGATRILPVETFICHPNELYITGVDSSSQASVVKLTSGGINDTSFGGGDGIGVFTNTNFTVRDMAVIAEGSVFLIGDFFNGSDYDIALVKFFADGTVDTGFGSSGLLVVDSGSSSRGLSIANRGSNLYLLSENLAATEVFIHKLNTSGTLNSTFGTAGVVTLTSTDANSNGDIKIDSLGNLWLYVQDVSSQNIIVRLDSSGKLDQSFINAGVAPLSHNLVNWSAVKGFELETAVSPNQQQAIIFGTQNNDFALSHMNNNGAIIDGESEVLLDFGFGDDPYVLALDSYSRAVLAGASYNSTSFNTNPVYARFNNVGTADTTLNSGNAYKLSSDAGGNKDDVFSALSITPSSKVLATGVGFPSTDADIQGLKTASDSVTVDSQYASSGIISIDISGNSEDISKAHYLNKDGELFIVGSKNNQAMVYKLSRSGIADVSFGASGVLSLNIGTSSVLNGITQDNDGNLIAVGTTTTGGVSNGIVVRIDSLGALDNSFAASGIATFNAVTNDGFNDVALSPDGHIIATGSASGDFLLVKYKTSDGALDTTGFGSGAGYIVQNFDGYDQANALAIDNYGGIFVAGNSDGHFALARFKGDGSILQQYPLKEIGIGASARDVELDSMGNAYITGSAQIDQVWKFILVRYPLAAAPY